MTGNLWWPRPTIPVHSLADAVALGIDVRPSVLDVHTEADSGGVWRYVGSISLYLDTAGGVLVYVRPGTTPKEETALATAAAGVLQKGWTVREGTRMVGARSGRPLIWSHAAYLVDEDQALAEIAAGVDLARYDVVGADLLTVADDLTGLSTSGQLPATVAGLNGRCGVT